MGRSDIGRRLGLKGRLLRFLALLMLLACLPVIAGALLPRFSRASAPQGPLCCAVERGVYLHEIMAKGEIESSLNVEVVCEAEARGSSWLKILELVPEGTFVKPGDFLCRLDGSALDANRVEQQIECNSSLAELIEARTDYEVALANKEEYLNGLFKMQRQSAEIRVLQSQENVRKAREQYEGGRKLDERGFITPLQHEAERFAVQRAENELHADQVDLEVLDKYTRAKRIKLLDSSIAIAAARLKSREHIYKLDVEELKEIEDNIGKCIIRSPAAGQVVYAHLHHNGHSHLVKEGEDAMEGRVMFRLPNTDHMQVIARVREEHVAYVRPGMSVVVQTDAIPGVALKGEVEKVNEYPEPIDYFGPNVNEYETTIRITTPSRELRPGLSANVTILADRQINQLMLPLQAIIKSGDKHFCITNERGGWQSHELKLGPANGKYAIIRGGIKEGTEVVLNAEQYRKLAGLAEEVSPLAVAQDSPG